MGYLDTIDLIQLGIIFLIIGAACVGIARVAYWVVRELERP